MKLINKPGKNKKINDGGDGDVVNVGDGDVDVVEYVDEL